MTVSPTASPGVSRASGEGMLAVFLDIDGVLLPFGGPSRRRSGASATKETTCV